MLPNYMALLAELASELGKADIAKSDPAERANTVRRVLAGKHALIVIDNLETLDETERVRVFQFLGRFPGGQQGHRHQPAAQRRGSARHPAGPPGAGRCVRAAGRTGEPPNPRLVRATAAERQMLYELTHGNPLLIQWTAGRVGRGAVPRRGPACNLLHAAPTMTRWNTSSATWWRLQRERDEGAGGAGALHPAHGGEVDRGLAGLARPGPR